MDYGLPQQLHKRGWVPGFHSTCYGLVWARSKWSLGRRSSCLVCSIYGQFFGVSVTALSFPIPPTITYNLALARRQSACTRWTPGATNVTGFYQARRVKSKIPVLHGCVWVNDWSKILVCNSLTGLLRFIFGWFQLISAHFRILPVRGVMISRKQLAVKVSHMPGGHGSGRCL